MKIQRIVKGISSFLAQLSVALLKAVLTSAILGMVLVTVMHYMGVPVPSADELERRRLEALEPGITQVEWGPHGEVLMPGHLPTQPGKL